MPLVYPPNFEGVRLTYEYDHVFSLLAGDTPDYAIPLNPTILTNDYIEVAPGYCLFYFESVNDYSLKVVGFVNVSSDNRTARIYAPSPKTYYYAYAGAAREGDACFVSFKCRMALNGTFSNPVYMRVFLEMGVNYAEDSFPWDYLPVSAYLDFGQTQS